MNPTDRWLLPEGIEEVLPPQALRLESLRRRLLDLYASWGYELVMPPFIEYLESLLTGMGNDLDLQTFKLTDQLTGRLMGVRADITPQAARMDAHQLQREGPVRLCYMGTVLRTRPDGFAGSRGPLQVGAELFGHGGVESDLEVLRLMLETLAVTGVGPVHLDLGHVQVFRALAGQAGLTADQEALLFDAMQRKARADIEECLAQCAVDAQVRGMLAALADLNGGREALEEAGAALAAAPAPVHAALERLRRVAAALGSAAPHAVLHFDLAELRGYHYHTGLVFAAFVPGHGQAVAQGGRYDEIGRVFGRARPATGFSADAKILMRLGSFGNVTTPGAILAPTGEAPALQATIAALRAAGERVIQTLPGQSGGARELGCDRVLVERNGHWVAAAAPAAVD